MAIAMHVPTDHRAVDNAHGGEKRRRYVVFHRAGSALVERQPRLPAIERLILALLVEPSNDGVEEWVHHTRTRPGLRPCKRDTPIHPPGAAAEFAWDQIGAQIEELHPAAHSPWPTIDLRALR